MPNQGDTGAAVSSNVSADERRLGEILRAMAQNGERQRRGDTRPGVESSAVRLSDLGIPRDRASRAMQLAEVPQ